MSKNKISYEVKLSAVKRYERRECSYTQIARELGVGATTIRDWLQKYETFGSEGLRQRKQNQKYSPELKNLAVQDYLSGKGSLEDISKKHKIHSNFQLRHWIMQYNTHKDFCNISGKRSGLNMIQGRETTNEERVEIVSYCIEHSKNYAETIEKYGVSYQQIYSWVRKYESNGVQSLEDKRGKRKAESELTEIERMKAENRLLQAQNRRLELENAIIKKMKELERGGY